MVQWFEYFDMRGTAMVANTFSALRRKVHAQCLIRLGKRMARGSLKPTIQEISLGSFLQDLEIQVRDAVLDMNKKGYCTWSSGFYGKKAELQGIDGPFVFDKETLAKLTMAGAEVETEKFWGRNYTSIQFYPARPDTALIIREWKKLTALIPPRGYEAILPENYGSAMFWEQYVSHKQIEIMRLKRRIGARQNPRWMKRWKTQLKRLLAD